MVAVPALQESSSRSVDGEDRFLLRGVPWSVYVALRDALDDAGSRVWLTYLDGTLELMSPSSLHEEGKRILARLLEAWSFERDVDLRGFGSTTFRQERKKRGLEADECYTLGPLVEGGVPDIAIEAIVTNPLLDKLPVYVGLGVREVWVWRAAPPSIVVHCLVDGAYVAQEQSGVLPGLDVQELVRFIRPGESHNALVKEYLAVIRSR